jgi:tungstate transport system ATP-binding protein
MSLIRLENLAKTFDGRQALADLSLEIDRGEIFALIGPTGAGKTTLIRLLDTIDFPSGGRILFDGVDITRLKRHRLNARRRMSYVQQKPIVFNMSVFDNVACGLRWRHENKNVIRRKVEASLELVGLSDHMFRFAKLLSGGETQRVALARALVTEPEVLFLDEPTANLDTVSITRIEEVLTRIIAEWKTTVILATHDIPQGYRLATRIGVLIDGKLWQVGGPDEILRAPKSRKVAEFVGVENILTGKILKKKGELATIGVGENTIDAISDYSMDDTVDVLVRPEDIIFTLSSDPSSARNVLKGKITRMTPTGSLIRIELDCGFPLQGILTTSSSQELELEIGKSIFANFKATAIHTIKRQT